MRIAKLSLLPFVLVACRVEGTTKYVPDRDEDGVSEDVDCDETDPAIGLATTYYFDGDRDGHGNPATAQGFCDQPEGYTLVADDCDDDNAAMYPGAEDVCDGLDNDCDGSIDNGLQSTAFYTDADGDGYGDDATELFECSAPEGMVELGGDCNDADTATNPGAVEEDCEDPNDYNCDGSVGYADDDADGFAACQECDDGNPDVRPDALETCNGQDDDCDTLIDDEDDSLDASAGVTVYADTDLDGYGDPASPAQVCEAGGGWVEDATDCDDLNPGVNPGAPEVCNGLDDDCDSLVDDDDDSLDASTGSPWLADADGDGYGDDALLTLACLQPAGTTDVGGDCDDGDGAYNPGATEADCTDPNDYNCDGSVGYVDGDGDGWAACEECDDLVAGNYPGADETCDGADNDCDGTVDEADALDAGIWYADADTDGYGNAGSSVLACSAPSGYGADATDCDDTDAGINPAAIELCDGVDQDCDGAIDDSAADSLTWYADSDLDGFGDVASTVTSCSQPTDYLSDDTDCDDADGAVHPGATERCDGIDNNCVDGIDEDAATDVVTWYADADGDAYGDSGATVLDCDQPTGYEADADDCDDTDAAINPAAVETCDGVDSNCDGIVDDASSMTTWYADADTDGYGDSRTSTASCSTPTGYVANDDDCDDTNSGVNPAAVETCDGEDDDCDGVVDNGVTTTWYRDADLDSYGATTPTTDSCTSPAGYADNDDDCDDTDATVYPGASDVRDGVDNDCDGVVDDGWWVGTGADGALNVPAGSTLTLSAGDVVSAISGADVTVVGTPGVAAGDEVLIINMHGTDGWHTNVGNYEFIYVTSVSGSVVTLDSAPTVTFGESANSNLGGQAVQMVRVPQYTNVTVDAAATLTTAAWDSEVGGVLAFRATGTVTLASAALITVDDLGYWGGETGTASNNDGFQGESYAGEGDGNLSSSTGSYGNYAAGYYLANYGGGGAMITGGGGNYAGSATAGDEWYPGVYPEADPGDTYGDVALDDLFGGSGGGGVWHGSSSPGAGGDGAGILFIGAQELDVTSASSITAIGGTTTAWATGTWTYGAGGGAGGSIWIIADTLTVAADAFDATGGYGESTHTRVGGDGGEGRIRLDFNEINGYMSTASAATREANTACDPDPGTIGTP